MQPQLRIDILSPVPQEEENYELKHDDDIDLFFATEKHEGWVNVYKEFESNTNYMGGICNSEEETKKKTDINGIYLATVKIEWEE